MILIAYYMDDVLIRFDACEDPGFLKSEKQELRLMPTDAFIAGISTHICVTRQTAKRVRTVVYEITSHVDRTTFCRRLTGNDIPLRIRKDKKSLAKKFTQWKTLKEEMNHEKV